MASRSTVKPRQTEFESPDNDVMTLDANVCRRWTDGGVTRDGDGSVVGGVGDAPVRGDGGV